MRIMIHFPHKKDYCLEVLQDQILLIKTVQLVQEAINKLKKIKNNRRNCI